MQLASLKAFVRNIVASWATIPTATANYSSTYKVEMTANYYLLLVSAGLLSGKHVPRPQPRVFYGDEASIEDVPWQVSVQKYGVHHCGGGIFSDRIIITAAHCFYIDLGGTNFRLLHNLELIILAGTSYKRLSTIYTGVSAKVHHEKYKYNKTNFEYDIGIMKVSDKLPLSIKVKPIPLAKSIPKEDTMVIVSGWGKVYQYRPSNQLSTENLRHALIPILKKTSCLKNQPSDVLCVGNERPSTSPGDDGGAAVYNNELVGIIVGQLTNSEGPTILINVPHYHNWLLNAINEMI